MHVNEGARPSEEAALRRPESSPEERHERERGGDLRSQGRAPLRLRAALGSSEPPLCEPVSPVAAGEVVASGPRALHVPVRKQQSSGYERAGTSVRMLDLTYGHLVNGSEVVAVSRLNLYAATSLLGNGASSPSLPE